MIQVYKKNELFIIEDTVRDTLYPNLTRQEAIKLLKEFGREEVEERVDYPITDESDMDFKYKDLYDPKTKAIKGLEKVKAIVNDSLKTKTNATYWINKEIDQLIAEFKGEKYEQS